jgi:hypothetical protein
MDFFFFLSNMGRNYFMSILNFIVFNYVYVIINLCCYIN